MAGGRIHVAPHGDEWKVEREGDAAPLSTHATRKEARLSAREVARRESAELVIHNRHGEIARTRTFEAGRGRASQA